MQDEVTKHSRRIFRTMKSRQKTFMDKVKEVSVEIFIIVFSVTLSIWLHSWSQHRHQQLETAEFLADLKDDLNKDIEGMASQKDKRTETMKQYSLLAAYTKKQVDSLSAANASVNFPIDLTIRKTNNGNYEGFRSSGKIGYIENKNLKKLILKYYQEAMPSLEDVEKYYNTRVNRTEELITGAKKENDVFLDPVVKTSLSIALQIAENNKRAYEEITNQAKAIIVEIEKEENE